MFTDEESEMKSQRTKNEFVELRAQGLSYNQIAKRLHVSKQTLINWGKQLNQEIEELRALELEVLREKYYIVKQRRIELFGEEILKFKNELSQRNLKKVQTHRLYDLLIKVYTLLEREEKMDIDVEKKRVDIERVKCLLGEDREGEPKFYLISTDFAPGGKVPDGDHVIDLTGRNWQNFVAWKKGNQK